MARQFNEYDLRLLGYESVNLKHDEPDELSVYDAVAKAGADRVTHRFIYLKSKCTRKGAHRAVSYLSESPVPAKTYGVKASSRRGSAVLGIVERAGCRLQSHEDLVWQQLGDVFRPYLSGGGTGIDILLKKLWLRLLSPVVPSADALKYDCTCSEESHRKK